MEEIYGIDLIPESILADLDIHDQDFASIQPRWRRSHYRAILNWLQYNPKTNLSYLDAVKGLLEAFHHFCALEDWHRASLVMSLELNTLTQDELQEQLGIWGYYTEQIQLFETILGKINPTVDSVCLNGLGGAYHSLGNYSKAIDYHQKNRYLEPDRINPDALGGLGNVYASLGDYKTAHDYFQQWLPLTQESGDRKNEAKAHGSLGNVYEAQGNYDQALLHFQQCLKIAQEINDPITEGRAYGAIANLYDYQGQYARAFESYQTWLTLAQEMGDRDGERRALENLGSVYSLLENYPLAIQFCEQALLIALELENITDEIRLRLGLGEFYYALEDFQQGIHQFQQALALLQTIEDQPDHFIGQKSQAWEYLGVGYGMLEQYEQSIHFFKKNLAAIEQTGDLLGQGMTARNLRAAYEKLGNQEQADRYLQIYLEIALEIRNHSVSEPLNDEERTYLQDAIALCENSVYSICFLPSPNFIHRFEQTGLKVTSKIKAARIVTLDYSMLQRKLGNLSVSSMKQLDQALINAFQIEH